ncbi:alanine dehydrogenase [Aquirufa aurantiipilula]|uniref:alanine dehydrogenase n=1 Tax=Aquirufa aurantiipilula TaxID=2696561 RepID=UPI001CAA739B|nr:alanine dehydrogenase [Aquirufa aurantiipilula]MBZ1325278.1 alanine dehydrogenase [Aquirufa aurantiipilula]
MIIGVPKEIKNQEFRVGLTPAGVQSLVAQGHQVYVQSQAGIGSGFSDEFYMQTGASILPDAASVYAKSHMIVKVKEPLAQEYPLIQPGQILFTYFHFAASKELTQAMIDSKAICIAYETVELPDRSLPLLTPMSEVAGRMSIQVGAYFLGKAQGGKGKMLGGVPGVKPANVVILGGGVVGTQAAKMAAGLGANVTILDTNLTRLRYLEDVLPANVSTQYSTSLAIQECLPQADLIVGAVLLHGAKAPHLIKREDLKRMSPGTVLVDVAVDQGGCIETCRPTTHENPVFEIDGILHYCVANMPGAVPQTSTLALTQATLPYVQQIAREGWNLACSNNQALANGLTIYEGKLQNPALAILFDL